MYFWTGLIFSIIWMVITVEICRRASTINTKFDYAIAIMMALTPLTTFYLGLQA